MKKCSRRIDPRPPAPGPRSAARGGFAGLLKKALWVVAAVSSVCACADPEPDPVRPALPIGEVEVLRPIQIADDVVAVEQISGFEGVEVQPDRLTFFGSLRETDVSEGSILVGIQDNGYMRRVISVHETPEGLNVTTATVGLADVIVDGHFRLGLPTTPETQDLGAGIAQSTKGLTPSVNVKFFDAKGLPISCAGGVSLGSSANTLDLSFDVDFKPTIEIDIGVGGLRTAKIGADATLDFSGRMRTKVPVSVSCSYDVWQHLKSAKLAAPFQLPAVYALPGVPFPILLVHTIEPVVQMSVTAGPADVEVAFSSNVTAGALASYENSNWSLAFDANAGGTGRVDVFGSSGDAVSIVSLGLNPGIKYSTRLFGTVGPLLVLKPNATLRPTRLGMCSADWVGTVAPSVEVGAEFQIQAFGTTIRSVTPTLKQQWSPAIQLWSRTTRFPWCDLDAGVPDAGSVDAAGSDASIPDGAPSDASLADSSLDAGRPDGAIDAGPVDGGSADGGNSDAGMAPPQAGYVVIPAGAFTMGSPPSELGHTNDEIQHQATITRSFYMKATEVTQAEWTAVMGSNPSYFPACGGNCPVEQVSWFDGVAYMNALSAAEGLQACYDVSGAFAGLSCTGYRYPTESEWEYAARAGTTTAFHTGPITSRLYPDPDPALDRAGWYYNNSGHQNQNGTTHAVAQKEVNAFGLYDMHGNVWEWTHDWYGDYSSSSVVDSVGAQSGSYRVFRGGSLVDNPQFCRSARRRVRNPGYRNGDLGLRPARSIP